MTQEDLDKQDGGEHPTVWKLISLKFHSVTRLTAFQS